MARKLGVVGVAVESGAAGTNETMGEGVGGIKTEYCFLENDKSTKMAQRDAVPQQLNS